MHLYIKFNRKVGPRKSKHRRGDLDIKIRNDIKKAIEDHNGTEEMLNGVDDMATDSFDNLDAMQSFIMIMSTKGSKFRTTDDLTSEEMLKENLESNDDTGI